MVARTLQAIGLVLGVQHLFDRGIQPLSLDVLLALLVDCGIQKERKHHRSRTVNRHRHRRGRIAEVKSAVQTLGIVEAAHRNTGVANLTVDVGAATGIASIKCYRIKGRRKPFGRRAQRHIVKALVGPLWPALTGKHARWVLALALEGVQARGIGKLTRNVFLKLPAQNIAPASVRRGHHLGNVLVRKRLRVGRQLDVLSAHLVDVLAVLVALAQCTPAFDQRPVVRIQVALAQLVGLLNSLGQAVAVVQL